jgi:hypothetical protein
VFFLFSEGNGDPLVLLGRISITFNALESAGKFGVEAFDGIRCRNNVGMFK